MDQQSLRLLAESFLGGQLSESAFMQEMRNRWTLGVSGSQIDLDRQRRCGFPEVVYGEGKQLEEIRDIFLAQQERQIAPFATRITPEYGEQLKSWFPEAEYNALGRTFRFPHPEASAKDRGKVAIITAGTSDRPVAEEAIETARWIGCELVLLYDIGVAGPQRLLQQLPLLQNIDVAVVIAGMEGALPSVVGGHLACPVIAVPTSVGYGASLGGMTALLGMLNSCASNVTVVNIDAGFKGAYVAGLMAQKVGEARNQLKKEL
ncbi:Phosphoribosylaminoimidazole carboxylase catalytic subunit [Planctomycetales bacterium 10988]|nr:Phosphoribosylaminoimidazole carboxylase catalytic subunit [Planctomycetales bacterium 10988]